MSTAPVGPAGRSPAGRPTPRKPPPARRSRPAPAGSESDGLHRLATAFATLFLEVEAGQRPRAHLGPLLDDRLALRLAPVWVRPGPTGTLLSVRGVAGEGVYDAVALVRRGSRVGALCLRLVHTSTGWRVSEAARPEDGPLPDVWIAPPDDEPEEFPLVRAVG